MNDAPLDPRTARLVTRTALIVGGVALALCAFAAFQGTGATKTDVVEAWLTAWWFFLGLSLGSLAVVMVHYLTGGRWGRHVRPPLEAAIRALPLLALLFIPLLFGSGDLYEWMHPSQIRDPTLHEVVQKKLWYLNRDFFTVRAILYFAIWLLLALRFAHTWARYGDDAPEHEQKRLRVWSSIGLIVYALTITFAAVDWVMSLVPEWYSTTFGLLTGTGQSLGGFAFGIVGASVLPRLRAGAERASADELNDLANLMLMFVMLWAYLAFTEYLIIWAEDLQHENAWHLPRLQTNWRWLGLFLVLFQFAVPFLVLLFRAAKRRARVMLLLGAGLLFVRWADTIWVISPSLHRTGVEFHWTQLAALIGIGGLWLANVTWLLGRQPGARSPARLRELEHG